MRSSPEIPESGNTNVQGGIFEGIPSSVVALNITSESHAVAV